MSRPQTSPAAAEGERFTVVDVEALAKGAAGDLAAEIKAWEAEHPGEELDGSLMVKALQAKAELANAKAEAEARVVAETASRVVFYGLQQLLPLITPTLLQFPLLCSRLFVLIAFMVEVYPEKLRALDPAGRCRRRSGATKERN